MSQDELLTPDQLARRLGVRPRTIREWARKGRVPAMRLSRKVVRFDWETVLSALRQQAARLASHEN